MTRVLLRLLTLPFWILLVNGLPVPDYNRHPINAFRYGEASGSHGVEIPCGSFKKLKEGDIFYFRSPKTSSRYVRNAYVPTQQRQTPFSPRLPFPTNPAQFSHPPFYPYSFPVSRGRPNQYIKPRICAWHFRSDGYCQLAANFEYYEPGDLNCNRQYTLISDEEREVQFCGYGPFPGFFKSAGASLSIKHFRKPQTWSSDFEGFVTCVKHRIPAKVVEYGPLSVEITSEEKGVGYPIKAIGSEAKNQKNVDDFGLGKQACIFPSQVPQSNLKHSKENEYVLDRNGGFVSEPDDAAFENSGFNGEPMAQDVSAIQVMSGSDQDFLMPPVETNDPIPVNSEYEPRNEENGYVPTPVKKSEYEPKTEEYDYASTPVKKSEYEPQTEEHDYASTPVKKSEYEPKTEEHHYAPTPVKKGEYEPKAEEYGYAPTPVKKHKYEPRTKEEYEESRIPEKGREYNGVRQERFPPEEDVPHYGYLLEPTPSLQSPSSIKDDTYIPYSGSDESYEKVLTPYSADTDVYKRAASETSRDSVVLPRPEYQTRALVEDLSGKADFSSEELHGAIRPFAVPMEVGFDVGGYKAEEGSTQATGKFLVDASTQTTPTGLSDEESYGETEDEMKSSTLNSVGEDDDTGYGISPIPL